MKPRRTLTTLLLSFCLITACAMAEASPTEKSLPPSAAVMDHEEEVTRTPSFTPQPSPTNTQPSPTISPTPTLIPTEVLQVCSPLEDIPISELPDTIVNPFSPPPSGSDDPHQGIDFADLFGEERIAIAGRRVNAVLSGEVVAVIADRFPYGNALIVETDISELPAEWLHALPTPVPTPQRRAALSCPEGIPSPILDEGERSLYLLYAHLQEPPALQIGDQVSCNQELGIIGSSGNALNPHLHLEARLGPSGAEFTGMAHYETRATPEEMHAYCLWRTSGHFQMVDPLTILDPSSSDR